MGTEDFVALRGLITQIFENKNAPIYKSAIHKILYKLFTDLPEDNKIREQLPFYWYNYGPFSEVVANELDLLKKSGVLEEVMTSTENTMLKLSKFEEFPDDPDFAEASHHLKKITREVNLYNFKPFISEIYKKNAPIKFIPLFKLDFLDPLGDLADTSNVQRSEINSLERALYKCEAYLPSEKIFDEFNNSFSSFVTTTSRIFDYVAEEEDPGFLTLLCSIGAEQTWKTFAKGSRIIYHHDYYNGKVPNWNCIYNKSLKIYIREVESYYEDVLTEITREKLLIPSLDKQQVNSSPKKSRELLIVQ